MLKMQRVLVSFIVIYNMMRIKHYITSRFTKLGLVKELQGCCEFNEKLTIKLNHILFLNENKLF